MSVKQDSFAEVGWCVAEEQWISCAGRVCGVVVATDEEERFLILVGNRIWEGGGHDITDNQGNSEGVITWKCLRVSEGM